ncbi:hypothetical protein AURDEDRAFT_168660 [Auricularia subglabra TFB-10046 SS5]|nr:hypothetical protein AURDEDRAFT_168660 [Auricularia subglabra TFB-10046 SS5]
MAQQLADETLAAIFFDHFDVSDDDFACITSRQSPFALRPFGSSSNVLLVCKRWMRVATPLLYETVILRSGAQAASLAFALKSSPSLGLYIKKLRVEGGFGAAGARILEASPYITDLWLTLDLYAQDRTIPMYTAMANRVNPRRLLVYGRTLPKNGNSNNAVDMLCQYIGRWSNLRAVYISTVVVYETPIGQALSALTQLEVLRVADFHTPPPSSTFLRGCLARRIELCFMRDDLIDTIMGRLEGLSPQTRNRLVIMRQVPRFLVEGQDTPSRTARHSCLLTCKLFQSLGIPIFCQEVHLKSNRSVISFASLLQDRPHLAPRVRSLVIRERPPRDPPRDWAGPVVSPEANVALLAVLPQAQNLVHIDLLRLAVSQFSDLHTEKLTYARLFLRRPDPPRSYCLPRFAQLTALALNTNFILSQDIVFSLSSDDALPLLDTLTLVGCGFDGPGLSSQLTALPLPRLKVLDIRELSDPTHSTDKRGNGWALFARAHGAKLRTLLSSPWMLAEIVPHCPNIVELHVLGTGFGNDAIAIPVDGFRDVQHPFAKLKTLVCPGFGLDKWPLLKPRAKIMKPFNEFFEYLASCSLFPALHTVRVDDEDLWPTSEREIAKSVIARCAETLLERGVTMFDRNGLNCKPRLKAHKKGRA